MLQLKRSKGGLIVGIIMFLLAGLAVGIWWWSSHPLERQETSSLPEQVEAEPGVVGVTSRVLFTGNSFWGRYTNDRAMRTDSPYTFPFEHLSEFDRQAYDAWVTGLECPVTEKGTSMTSAQMEATLTFNCDPAYLGEFAKWFTVVSLANNHTDNMGADGFSETQQALSKHSIQYFGHYDSAVLDEICDVMALPVKVGYDNDETKEGYLPIAMCGHHFVYGLPSAESVAQISKYSAVMPTIAMPHGGAEYKAAPDQIKTQLMHDMIDAGADMVIGDHAHWVQTTEAYKGKLIVYSMGNFMFDQQFNQEVVRSAAIDVQLEIDGDTEGLEAWLELGESCKDYADDCLAEATRLGLDRLKPIYKFDVVATDNSGYQVKPAPELMPWLKQRLQWDQTMQALEQ